MSTIFNYHTTISDAMHAARIYSNYSDYMSKISDRFKNPCFGVEIEKQNSDYKQAEEAEEIVKRAFFEAGEIWIKERDGSLNSSGYELKSPPKELTPNAADLLQFFAPVSYLINADETSGSPQNCGGHIHLSHPQYRPAQLYQYLLGCLPVLYALYIDRITESSTTKNEQIRKGQTTESPRYKFSGGYCNPKPIARDTRHDPAYMFAEKNYLGMNSEGTSDSRYNAISVNSSSGKTLEFRLFPIIHDTATLVWRVQLIELFLRSYFRQSEQQIGKAILDPSSELNRHLSELYTPLGIVGIYRLFIVTARDLHSVPFRPNSEYHQKRVQTYLEQTSLAASHSRPITTNGRKWARPYAKIRAAYADIKARGLNHTQLKAKAEIGKNDSERNAISHERTQLLNEQNKLNALIKSLSDKVSINAMQASGQKWRDALSALNSDETRAIYAELSKAQADYNLIFEKTDILRNAANQIREAEKLFQFLAEDVTPEPEPDQSRDNTERADPPTTQTEC
jgi:hypothetical protein